MIKQYPITFACGSLVLVFIVPKTTAFGLVGIERAFLSSLLELEQLLVVAFLTGAKWVRSNLDTHICRIVWLSLRDEHMLMAFQGQFPSQVMLLGAIVGAAALVWYESCKKKS